jgi:hypothetical protein
MKESIIFIKGKINELFNEFPTLKIRYEFRATIGTHLIEILPVAEYEANHDYILFEMNLENEFESLYGAKEDILFISSDSLMEIRDVQFCLGYVKPTISLPHTFRFAGLNELASTDDTSYFLAA